MNLSTISFIYCNSLCITVITRTGTAASVNVIIFINKIAVLRNVWGWV